MAEHGMHVAFLASQPEDGESVKAWKQRRIDVCLQYVRDFLTEHGHTYIPKGVVIIGRVDAFELWQSLRSSYRTNTVSEEVRAVISALERDGADMRTEAEIARARREARENLAPLEEKRYESALQAIRDFARRHGHTNIPGGVISKRGARYGVTANAWRRLYANGTLSPWLTKELEQIPEWTWRIAEGPISEQEVVLPPDTTQMRQAGLKQYLPDT